MAKYTNVEQRSGAFISKRAKWILITLGVSMAMTKASGEYTRFLGVGLFIGTAINIINHLATSDDDEDELTEAS